MKCKICGSEIAFQNGKCLCKSCGATFALDSIYENVDVCICYQETDAAGRRTKDSIVAQEVYRKLEENRITTFYERVSADALTGSDLETSKLAAIHKAKVVLVLGASAESFAAIAEKYGAYFNAKPIIPFCVDVNPSVIPRTISKIQALSYSTIGWDQDLIKGVCNILGREQPIDTGVLYGRKQAKTILISAIAIVVVAFTVIASWLYLKSRGDSPSASPAQETAESATEPFAQGKIYDIAQELLSSGKYMEAAQEFNKIPDYKDSSNQVKKIYDRYDGYYQGENDSSFLYLNVIDGKTAEVSFERSVENKIVKIKESVVVENNALQWNYIDSFSNEGSASVAFCNDVVELNISTSVINGEISLGEIAISFPVSSKMDRPPIKSASVDHLLTWVSEPTTLEDVQAAGFEVEYISKVGEADISYGEQYKIINSEIILITSNLDLLKYHGQYDNFPLLDEHIITAVIGPVSILCPDKVEQSSCVFKEDGAMYVPYAYNLTGPDNGFFYEEYMAFIVDEANSMNPEYGILPSLTIEKDALVGVVSQNIVGQGQFDSLWETHNGIYNRTVEKSGDLGGGDTPYLVAVSTDTHNVYSEPTYSSAITQALPIGTYTIVEERTDQEGNLWGKLKSGVGWICLTEIQSES